MIPLPLQRDEMNLIEQQWLPLMIQLAWSHLRNNSGNHGKYLNSKIIITLLSQVQLNFKKKAVSPPKKIRFSFTEAEGAALYVYLMRLPLHETNVWACLLRQNICNVLYEHLFADMPKAETPPATPIDYFQEFFEPVN